MKNKLDRVYTDGIDLMTWDKENKPDDDLICKDGMSEQIKKIKAVADILSCKFDAPRVVEYHSSKSVKLPVTCFKFEFAGEFAYVFIRDNFYDIKVVVMASCPVLMPYHVVHTEWSKERYDREVERYVGYTKNERPDDGSDEWYSGSWSNGAILRHEGRIYRSGSYQSVYCEGIDDLSLPKETFKPYEYADDCFSCSVDSYPSVAVVLECINCSLVAERYKRD